MPPKASTLSTKDSASKRLSCFSSTSEKTRQERTKAAAMMASTTVKMDFQPKASISSPAMVGATMGAAVVARP